MSKTCLWLRTLTFFKHKKSFFFEAPNLSKCLKKADFKVFFLGFKF